MNYYSRLEVAMRKSGLMTFAVGIAVVAVPVLAAASDIIRTRIDGYRELGAAFKGANDGLRGEPQTVVLQQAARQIRNASKAQYGWFPAGSGPKAGVKTAAKPAIWTSPAKFKAAQDGFARQAEAFQKAVAGGKADVMRTEARKLGGTCKACHDQFRVPKD
jgi:cytochrome c556